MDAYSDHCVSCDKDSKGDYDENDIFYCNDCWLCHTLMSYRCYTFAAVYDAQSGEQLGIGGSINDTCAERQALWNTDDILSEKIIVVCRIRKNRKDTKMSFGSSKPCAQCILAMQLYNVKQVCYSVKETKDFKWETVDNMSNNYCTKSNAIVRL